MVGAMIVFFGIGLLAFLQTAPATNALLPGVHTWDSQIILSLILPKVIEWMKQGNFGPLRYVDPKNPVTIRWTSALLAFFSTLGIAFTHTGSFWTSDGATVTFTGISIYSFAGALVHFSARFGFQGGMQEAMYNFLWKQNGKPLPEVQKPPNG